MSNCTLLDDSYYHQSSFCKSHYHYDFDNISIDQGSINYEEARPYSYSEFTNQFYEGAQTVAQGVLLAYGHLLYYTAAIAALHMASHMLFISQEHGQNGEPDSPLFTAPAILTEIVDFLSSNDN